MLDLWSAWARDLLNEGVKAIEIYTLQIGRRRLITEGPEVNKEEFYSWIELELFDDVSDVDKWLSKEDAQFAVWPLTGEWTRSPSNRRVSLRRRESGSRLARLYYNSWPWHKGDEGVAELDVTFDGTKKGVYIITQVN